MSETITPPVDLSISGTPAELVLTFMGLQPARMVGKTVLDVASGCSDVVQILNQTGATAFGVDLGYQNPTAMFSQNDTFNQRRTYAHSGTGAIFTSAINRFMADFDQNPTHYVAASAESLPFRDASVDYVLNNLFLASATPDEAYFDAILREWVRVMRKGGDALISIFPGSNSTVPTETRSQMNDSKRLIKSIGDTLVRTKKIRKIAERSHPIGSMMVLSK